MSAALTSNTRAADQADRNLQAAAQHVAQAAANHRKAAAAVAQAREMASLIQTRITEKHAGRTAIRERRGAGQQQPDDAGEMMLLSADLDGLEAERAAAEAVLDQAREPEQHAKAALDAARFGLQRAEDEAEEQSLVEWLAEADAKMTGALERLKHLHRTLGRGLPAWAPTHPLITELRRLRLAVGGLA